VVVVGANGAGKSTMIKCLTGETIPTLGSVWKHPNLRVAYVAQHAFHHLEKHLDKSPNEYIQWRYASGEDKEAAEKQISKLTEEEEKKMAEKVTIDGVKFQVEAVLARRKLKSSYEYDVKFVGLGPDKNQWLPRKWLEDNGFGKMVDQLDYKEAAMAGLHSKPLTAQNISKHLKEVGLDEEFSLHSRMRGLSGGQKVKVVLGAAMWNNPHMLVLDEPTNYLDRDSLGAFSIAIKDFGGGVLLITHNAEFANAICSETWLVEDGRLNVSGESWTKDEKLKEKEAAETFTDAAGNVVKLTQKVKLSKADMKKRIKARLKKAAANQELSDVEDWMEECCKEVRARRRGTRARARAPNCSVVSSRPPPLTHTQTHTHTHALTQQMGVELPQ
jgi:elongation factor 3